MHPLGVDKEYGHYQHSDGVTAGLEQDLSITCGVHMENEPVAQTAKQHDMR